MKSKIYLLAISLFIVMSGNCQFVPMNLNYLEPHSWHYPRWISIVDETGRVTEWNSALEKISGYSFKSVVGKYIWDVQYKFI